jgi:type VI protein secretion system component VasF
VSTLSPLERHARRRRRRREEVSRWAIRAVIVLIVFAFGIALGQALHDNPKTGGTVTLERTVSLPSVPPGSTIRP